MDLPFAKRTRRYPALLAVALALPLLATPLAASADQDRGGYTDRHGQPSHQQRSDDRNGYRNGYRGTQQRYDARDERRDNRREVRVAEVRERETERRRNDDTHRAPERTREANRYRPAPRHDYVVRELPRDHRVVHIHERDYYVHKGYYYVHEPRGYIRVLPPIGTFILSLPDGHISVRIGGIPYFVFGGVFYVADHKGYKVVEPPAPAPDMVGKATSHVIVSASLLNVRSGPSFDFPVIGIVNRGDNLPSYGNAPGWHYVRLPSGNYGWVSDDFVAVAEEPQG